MATQIATTNINIIPVRIEADHYQTPSFTEAGKTYDQIYNYDLMRWICNCGDAVERHNPNCKHNILLRAYIKREKAQQAPEQHHSSSQELMSILTRISNLEQAQEAAERENLLLQRDLEEHEAQISARAEQERILIGRLTNRELQIDKQHKEIRLQRELIGRLQETTGQQAQQIERQSDLIDALQSSVCRLNERTINQDTQIQQLIAAMAEQQRTIEDQAQQIDHLHEAVSAQQKPVEQVVRVVIDKPAPAPRQPREAAPKQAPESMEVTRVSKTECKCGKHTVPVVGNSAAGCSCAKGTRGQQCDHMIEVDKFLSK